MIIKGLNVARIALFAGVAAVGMSLSMTGGASAAGAACTEDWKPVCAMSNGFQRVYSNSCWAKMQKAKILYNGQCKWGQGK